MFRGMVNNSKYTLAKNITDAGIEDLITENITADQRSRNNARICEKMLEFSITASEKRIAPKDLCKEKEFDLSKSRILTIDDIYSGTLKVKQMKL